MINVMISDSDLFAREGIKQMLARYSDLRIVCETCTAAETLHALREHRPDVCMLEIAMAGDGGLQLLRRAKSQACGIPILVISHRHERDLALRALRAGAAGYITKDCIDHQLAYALRTAADHRPYVSETVCELIAESFTEVRTGRRHEKLSDSDFEIFCLMADGAPTAKVATACNMSIPVIRNRKARIMQQLGLRTDADLVKYAVGRKLLD
ncbi:response regulator transcription factor [Telluria aromaticivorans]|uniref:Response regulator transcription factor n=1 Tax=Telluria aromaticivorans TaxID=2725995 RepID=A0A7Y2NYA1_9BURK|nr:response regulator transcription factor [Telluria aromaticivorans]NNG21853.1 response regulator transcription factor [Telluria aromaticivorans]